MRRLPERRVLHRYDRFPDRPQRQPGKLQVRPGERDAHDGHGKQDRRDEVAERQPPSGEKQPHDVADHPKRAGANVFAAEIFVARYGLVAERQKRVGGDAERGSCPGQADNSDRHDHGGDYPAERHPQAAADDPEQVEKERDEGHRDAATTDERHAHRRSWSSHSRNSSTFRRFARHNTSKASPTSGTAPNTPSSATLPSMRATTWPGAPSW